MGLLTLRKNIKTKNYSRLLVTFVSFISMATTVGLSAKPGWSYRSGAKCTYSKTQEQVEFGYYTDDTRTSARVRFLYNDAIYLRF